MDCSTPGPPVCHHSRSLPRLVSMESVMPSNRLILCRPFLLLPSILPIIRVFSNESALRIRWPKYWSFSFSISPSNEHPGLISFRMDWLDLLCSPRDSQGSSPTPQFKSINSSALSFLYSPALTSMQPYTFSLYSPEVPRCIGIILWGEHKELGGDGITVTSACS